MQSPRHPKSKQPADQSGSATGQKPEAVPTVPAPALDGDYDWDPARDPAEDLDPATTWWGG
ncbi:MAG: hypothetical protein J0H94_00495 [Rhizobiales bacterium]|nr:hypothetical protein [Hyphomicrobiales bacterium]